MQSDIMLTILNALCDGNREELKKAFCRISLVAKPQDASDSPNGQTIFIDEFELEELPRAVDELIHERFLSRLGLNKKKLDLLETEE